MKRAGRGAMMMAGLIAGVASSATAQSWRFDFTGGAAPAGWESVADDQAFDPTTGHGFEPSQSEAPAFSVVAPEGDYRVTVTPAPTGPATVWAEGRRLMIEATTEPARFTVNVRRPGLPPPPINAPGGDRVRLDGRDAGSRSWDDRLTLVFDGDVARIEVVPVEVRRLFLLGDSTVADQGEGDYASWGQVLPSFLDDTISVANHARSGETLKSFLTGLRLDKALDQMRPGDVVLIQFGHNDAKAQWPQTHAEAATTFRSYLRVYVEEVRRRGATPILVTSPHRRTFGPDGRIANSHGDYPDAVRAVAEEMGAPLIDLTTLSATLYEALGPERAPLAFADQGRDPTHHNLYGARLLAWAVADGLRDLVRDAPLRPGVDRLDPSQPPPERFPTVLVSPDPAPAPMGS